MRQCENICVFIDLTKSFGLIWGGSAPPPLPPNSAYVAGSLKTCLNIMSTDNRVRAQT